ncbi:MAG: hypothetical protein ACREPI_02060 [Candidatus Dormibacterales bacterium]
MITREPTTKGDLRERASSRIPPAPPGPPEGPGRPWWMSFPPVPGRPRPMNRRNFLLGTAILGPFVLIVDALLGGAAWMATGSLRAGLAVAGGMAFVTCLELAIVAWGAKFRQDREARRAQEP